MLTFKLIFPDWAIPTKKEEVSLAGNYTVPLLLAIKSLPLFTFPWMGFLGKIANFSLSFVLFQQSKGLIQGN